MWSEENPQVIRSLLIHPLVVAITLALGVAVCKAMSLNLHTHEMVQALIVVIAASAIRAPWSPGISGSVERLPCRGNTTIHRFDHTERR